MIIDSFLIIFLSFFVSLLLTRKIVRFAYDKKFFDLENSRKIHHGNIPRVGGFAFVMTAIIVILIIISFARFGFFDKMHFNLDGFIPKSLAVVFSILIIYFFGIVDDLRGLRYRTKFSYQILVGLLLCLTGFGIANLRGVFGLANLPLLFGCVVTVFSLVLIINAFNFIDGIDGLASGIAIISLIYYSIILLLTNSLMGLFCLAFVGALIPFFIFNIFGKEAKKSKTFMGDTGSTVLGLVLFINAIFVLGTPKVLELPYNPFAVAFAPLLIPCYEVVNVVFYRLSIGRNPFKADNNHFHHKLIKLGYSQHCVLVVEICIILLVSSLTIILSKYININVILFLSLFIWIGINMLLSKKINKITQ